MIFLGIAQRCGDSALRRDGMRAGGKDLGQHGGLEAGLGQLNRGTQAGAASADNDRIEFANGMTHGNLQMI